MKTKYAAMSAGAVLLMVALAFAMPVMASPTNTTSPTPNSTFQTASSNGHQQKANTAAEKFSLTTGQTITLTSIEGGYWAVGDPTVNGTASGTLQLTVTGVLKHGYILSVTSGTIQVAGQTYTITSGSAELGPHGIRMIGQAATSGGQLLFHAHSIGSFGGTHNAIVRMDFSNGTTEYNVRLLVTATY